MVANGKDCYRTMGWVWKFRTQTSYVGIQEPVCSQYKEGSIWVNPWTSQAIWTSQGWMKHDSKLGQNSVQLAGQFFRISWRAYLLGLETCLAKTATHHFGRGQTWPLPLLTLLPWLQNPAGRRAHRRYNGGCFRSRFFSMMIDLHHLLFHVHQEKSWRSMMIYTYID